jgi:hypothetical protein
MAKCSNFVIFVKKWLPAPHSYISGLAIERESKLISIIYGTNILIIGKKLKKSAYKLVLL